MADTGCLAALPSAKAGVPHGSAHAPLNLWSEPSIVVPDRLVVSVTIHFRFRSGPVTEALAEPGRLVGEADLPFTQASEAEVGWNCSMGQRQAVVIVVVGEQRGRTLAKTSKAWTR